MLTLVEVCEKLKEKDEVELLELLSISSEELVSRCIDIIEDKYDELENRCKECGCFVPAKAKIILDFFIEQASSQIDANLSINSDNCSDVNLVVSIFCNASASCCNFSKSITLI